MKKFQSNVEKHIIIDYIVLIILFLAFSKIPGLVSSIFSLNRNNVMTENFLDTFYLLLNSGLLLLFIRKCEFAKKTPVKNLGICLLMGFPFLINSIGYLLKLTGLPSYFYKVSGVAIVSVIIRNVAVGIQEELQFRGLIMQLFLRKYEDKKHPYLKAALFSSVLFGINHFLTRFVIYAVLGERMQSAELQSYLYQTFYAICGGMVFAAMTLYHNSLVPAIICHSIVDACCYLYQGLMQKTVYEAYVNSRDWMDILKLNRILPWKIGNIKVLNIVLYLLMLAYGIFLIYKLEKKVSGKTK